MNGRIDLELVHLTAKGAKYLCRCTPRVGQIQSETFECPESAFAWLIQLTAGKSIRLMTIRDFNLTNSLAQIQSAIHPLCIDLINFENVSLLDIRADVFKDLLSGAFRSDKYSFISLRDVGEQHFSSDLFTGGIFLNCKRLEVRIQSFQNSDQTTFINGETLINWYFNAKAGDEPRLFSSNVFNIDAEFIEGFIRRFESDDQIRPTSLIFYHNIDLYKEVFLHYTKGRRAAEFHNQKTGETLLLHFVSEIKIELVRTIDSPDTKLRPIRPSRRQF